MAKIQQSAVFQAMCAQYWHYPLLDASDLGIEYHRIDISRTQLWQ